MKISVFITSYNQKKYLIEAIESVLAQTLKPFQIIIVDDCSIDESQGVINGYCSRYPDLITPIYHAENVGVSGTRIDALNVVKGDYVTYLDGDDLYLPTKLEKEAKLLKENPNVQIAFSNNFYVAENGITTGIWIEGEMPPEGDVFKETFARDFPKGSLFRMELVDYSAWANVGFHDPSLYIYEDYDMRIRLTKKLKVKYYNEPLSKIRIHGKGISRSEIARHLEAFKYIYKKNSHLLGNLSTSDRLEVEKKWFNLFNRLEILATLEMGQRMVALRRHLSTLKKNPIDFKNYKFLFRLIFPDNIRKLISIVFRKFKRRP